MRFCYFIFLIRLSILGNAQSFNVDASIATDSKNNIFIYNISPSIGYSFPKNNYVFGGLKSQTYSLIPKYDSDENDLWSTTSILNIMFFVGIRYTIPVFKINKNSESEHIIGFFPECRIYFNPYVPRKIRYIDDEEMEVTVVGEYSTQFAHGIGFGVFIKETENNAYFAIKFEYSTIDAFTTLRDLDYSGKHFAIPTNTQYSIGISLFFL